MGIIMEKKQRFFNALKIAGAIGIIGTIVEILSECWGILALMGLAMVKVLFILGILRIVANFIFADVVKAARK